MGLESKYNVKDLKQLDGLITSFTFCTLSYFLH